MVEASTVDGDLIRQHRVLVSSDGVSLHASPSFSGSGQGQARAGRACQQYLEIAGGITSCPSTSVQRRLSGPTSASLTVSAFDESRARRTNCCESSVVAASTTKTGGAIAAGCGAIVTRPTTKDDTTVAAAAKATSTAGRRRVLMRGARRTCHLVGWAGDDTPESALASTIARVGTSSSASRSTAVKHLTPRANVAQAEQTARCALSEWSSISESSPSGSSDAHRRARSQGEEYLGDTSPIETAATSGS